MRRTWVIGLLVVCGRAEAWTWEPGPETELPAAVSAVEVVPHQHGSVILALGPTVSWLVDPSTGEELTTLPVSARDVALVDVSGDGQDDLLLCGPQGLHVMPWEGQWRGSLQRLDSLACESIETFRTATDTMIAAAGVDLRMFALVGPWQIAQRDVVEIPKGGKTLLASEGERVALSAVGASEIVEWSPAGTSTLATGGAVGGLAIGPWGWAWSLPEIGAVADMTHRTVPVDAQPAALVSGDLDRDGQRDLVVLHPTTGVVTFLLGNGATWSRGTLEGGAASAVVRDVDADGCDDVVVGLSDPSAVRVLRTADCAIATFPGLDVPLPPIADVPDDAPAADPTLDAGWHPPAPVKRPPEALGVTLPWFLGDHSARDVERLRGQQYVVVGSGWAMGGALRNVYLQIPFFPALSVEMEWGGPRVRWFIGGDSAALFLWMADEGSGIHLVNATTGVTFGSPRLRFGPFVTGGLVNFGAGWRSVFTPWDDGDTFKGIEVRMTWFYPHTGEVMVLYVWSQPMKEPRRRLAPRPIPPPEAVPVEIAAAPPAEDGVAEAPPEGVLAEEEVAQVRTPVRVLGRDDSERKVPAFFACRSFGISIGAAGGASSTRYSWEYVGSEVPLSPSVSPAIAAQCETGKGVGMLLGFETAPFYSYLTREDDRLHQMGSHTLGFMFGGEGFRIGPTATAGVWILGGGLRAAIKVREDRQGLIHQLDIRAMVHYPSAPAGQIMLLYGIAWNPWR